MYGRLNGICIQSSANIRGVYRVPPDCRYHRRPPLMHASASPRVTKRHLPKPSRSTHTVIPEPSPRSTKPLVPSRACRMIACSRLE